MWLLRRPAVLFSGASLFEAWITRRQSDFHQDGDEATLRLHEKGDKRRTIGIHFTTAQAISEYLAKASLTSGPPSATASWPSQPAARQPAVRVVIALSNGPGPPLKSSVKVKLKHIRRTAD
jgi:hypothetical protein